MGLVTFAFGLVHGFGFSFALRETLQFAGPHVWTSLLAFNLGVELGQLLVIAAFVPVVHLLFRFVVPDRIGTIVLSALVAHTAWHWMSERADSAAAVRVAGDLTRAISSSPFAWRWSWWRSAAAAWWIRARRRPLRQPESPGSAPSRTG